MSEKGKLALAIAVPVALIWVAVHFAGVSAEKEERRWQVLMDSCLSTGKPLYKCTIELSQKPKRTFDINFGFKLKPEG